MINAIVAIATLLGAAVVVLWLLRPAFRFWVEAPKFRLLEAEERFDATVHIPRLRDQSSKPNDA